MSSRIAECVSSDIAAFRDSVTSYCDPTSGETKNIAKTDYYQQEWQKLTKRWLELPYLDRPLSSADQLFDAAVTLEIQHLSDYQQLQTEKGRTEETQSKSTSPLPLSAGAWEDSTQVMGQSGGSSGDGLPPFTNEPYDVISRAYAAHAGKNATG